MKAKEYLNQVRMIDAEIQALKEQYHKAQLDAMFRGASDEPKVNTTSSGDAMANAAIRATELADLIQSRTKELEHLKCNVMKIIMKVPDSRYRILLLERYFNNHTWEEIAERMEYDERHIYRLHGEALNAFMSCFVSSKV